MTEWVDRVQRAVAFVSRLSAEVQSERPCDNGPTVSMHGGLVMRPSSLGQVEGGLKVTGCWRQGILLRNPGLADQEC